MKRISTAAVALALGCASNPGGSPKPAPATGDSAAAAHSAEIARVEERVLPTPGGVPHSDNLIDVALDERGTAALTLDAVGGLRFWAALDGSRAPALVEGSLTNLDLSRREDGWRAVGIDPAGAAVVLWIDKNGNASRVFATPPQPRALDAIVTSDDRVAVLGEDHVLRVLRSGRVVSSYGERGFRPTRIFEHAGSLSLVAMLADGNETHLERHRLRPAKDDWKAESEDETLPIKAADLPSQISFSPSGDKLALFARKGSIWNLFTVDLATGTVHDSSTELPRSRIPGGGWESETVFATLGNTDVRRIDVEGEHELLGNFPGPPGNLLPAAIRATDRVLVAGVGDHLFVIETGKRMWRYLGYSAVQEGYQVLSPSGARVAWRDVRGHAYVHDRETGRTRPLLTTAGSNAGLFFASDDLVLGYYSPQRLVMFDAETGKVTGELSGNLNNVAVGGDYLLVPQPGVVYQARDDGFEAVAMLGSYAHMSYLVKDGGEWRVLVIAKKDKKGRLLDVSELAGLTAEELDGRPVAHPHLSTKTLVDDRGRPYRLSGKNAGRLANNGTTSVSYSLPTGRTGRIVGVAPAGRAVLVSVQHDIYAFDGDTGKKLWSRANAYPKISWTRDGKAALVASRGARGFEIVDTETGKTTWKMCGHSFRASAAPPSRRRNNAMRMSNICTR